MKNLTTCTVDRSGEEIYPFDVDDIDYFAFLEKGLGEDAEITVGVGGRIFLFQGKAARGIHSLVSKSICLLTKKPLFIECLFVIRQP